MSTLTYLLAEHTSLTGEAVEHLQRVVAEWQLLSDLSFADFVAWVPLESEEPDGLVQGRFLCVAHARPTTALTSYPTDIVGSTTTAVDHPQLAQAIVERRICREEDPSWQGEVAIRREAVPVNCGGEIIAVLGRDTNLSVTRAPSRLELAYLESAADLCQMIADGTFPSEEPATDSHTSPRIGDGLIRLDAAGVVVFASPNALSAYHRMGHAADLIGMQLASLTRTLVADPFDATEVAQRIKTAVAGRPSMRIEAESRQGAAVLFRALPLRSQEKAIGALVLVRDVTEVKRRDRALLSKDATIRELHHRVKNNLQTVAALLRLQARRTTNAEAEAVLRESVRRVTSIALVHEALSFSVDERADLDAIVDQIIPMLADVATTEAKASIHREGKLGVLPAEVATPLIMVLTELVQNALQHAYPAGVSGRIVISAKRSAKYLDVLISDDGKGLPPGFSLERTDRLGLQIVRTLVESELRGSLSLRNRRETGAEAALRIPLRLPR